MMFLKISRQSQICFFLIVLMLSFSLATSAQSSLKLKSIKGTVSGTSTLHDWESDITKIEYKGTLSPKGKVLQTLNNVELKIPVESIKSHEGKIMDHKTYEAFKSEENPYITFSFSSAQVQKDAAQNVTIVAAGYLTMAGTSRPVTLTVAGKTLANGDIKLALSQKLKMTDYNIKPPVAILGTITVNDEITVNFEMLLSNTK